MLQNSFMMGGRLDRYSDWRLDIDHMSYEVVYIPLVAFYFDYTSWPWCVGLVQIGGVRFFRWAILYMTW